MGQAGLVAADGAREDGPEMNADIRKIAVLVEETLKDAGCTITPASRKAVAVAVIANPFAGRYVDDLSALIEVGEELGGLLWHRCVEALGISPDQVQSYGKAAMVGEAGELEHAAAILHPKLGAPLRAAVGGGAALVPSSKKMGGPGHVLDVPLGHKNAAYVRSHFDAIEVRLNDSPRASEIMVAVAVTDSGRPLARIGGLSHEQIEGKDGLR